MKSFFQFLSEAETEAASQAKKLGLKGDGHGGWVNRAFGEFVAKTVDGKLKFFERIKNLEEIQIRLLIQKR